MDPIPTYLRQRIVEKVQEGASVPQVAKRFAISATSVRNFVRLAKQGALAPQPRSGGPSPKLKDPERQRLVEAVDAQPDATLQELKQTCQLRVSCATISRELVKLDRPRKRKVPRASEQSEAAVQEQRDQWQADTSEVPAERFVFLDETGVTTNMTRSYARAPANERVYTDVPQRHYESLTVLGALRLDHSEQTPTLVYKGGTTAERMVEYITGPLRALLHPGDIVVADRLAAHTARRVADKLAEQEVAIWHLPPYSPDLNPIEKLWSKIKTSLRAAQAKTVGRLGRALQRALRTITDDDIHDWIEHSNYLVTT